MDFRDKGSLEYLIVDIEDRSNVLMRKCDRMINWSKYPPVSRDRYEGEKSYRFGEVDAFMVKNDIASLIEIKKFQVNNFLVENLLKRLLFINKTIELFEESPLDIPPIRVDSDD